MIQMINLQREMSDIGAEIRAAVEQSLKETWFVGGPRVREFEKRAAEYLGVKHAIGLNSGTDALHLALRAMGVKEGDEVITPAFTFIATAEVVPYMNATPVFVDVDEDTMNINIADLERKITAKTKAIVPVHMFGNPANMDAVLAVAKKHNIKVLEDCAQSFGATYKGKQTGSIGHAGAFSFYPTKNLGAYGDAGMITTNDDLLADYCRVVKEHGMKVRYHHDMIGFNSRLDDIQAAILNVKLNHIERFNEERARIAALYQETIGKYAIYQAPNPDGVHVYHQFTIRLKNRDAVAAELQRSHIASSIFYPIPLHLQKAFAYLGGKKGDYPVAEKLSNEVLSLPINPYLEDEEVAVIGNIVKSMEG